MEKVRMQCQVQTVGVVNGFCYPFAKALAIRLHALIDDLAIYKNGHWPERRDVYYEFSPVVQAIVVRLQEQVPTGFHLGQGGTLDTVVDFLEATDSFLNIFE